MTSFALLYLGKDPHSERPEDLAVAMEVLGAIRPYVRYITSGLVTTGLVEGEICFAVAPNADFRAARNLARETGRDVEIRYVSPKEGAILWVDTLAVPADAPQPDLAHRLIDYLMRLEVIAGVTEATGFANANVAGTALVADDLRRDTIVYPDAAARQRLHMNAALSANFTRLQNREFDRFRTGQ